AWAGRDAPCGGLVFRRIGLRETADAGLPPAARRTCSALQCGDGGRCGFELSLAFEPEYHRATMRRPARIGARRFAPRGAAVLLVAPLIALATTANAVPTTFTVNSLDDAVDAMPGDGVCETAKDNHVCTLRAAVQEANKNPGADTILLQPNVTYVLTIVG